MVGLDPAIHSIGFGQLSRHGMDARIKSWHDERGEDFVALLER
jgi:hypothetical protein